MEIPGNVETRDRFPVLREDEIDVVAFGSIPVKLLHLLSALGVYAFRCPLLLHDTFEEALPLIEPVCVSVAVSVSVPLLLKITVKVCTPASPATNV